MHSRMSVPYHRDLNKNKMNNLYAKMLEISYKNLYPCTIIRETLGMWLSVYPCCEITRHARAKPRSPGSKDVSAELKDQTRLHRRQAFQGEVCLVSNCDNGT